ncbi:MAG TPA: hypothetical protein DC054_14700 [Blastocatellia bacterium]|nr:hypothetical protein [Blastocatellia bacterium]
MPSTKTTGTFATQTPSNILRADLGPSLRLLRFFCTYQSINWVTPEGGGGPITKECEAGCQTHERKTDARPTIEPEFGFKCKDAAAG